MLLLIDSRIIDVDSKAGVYVTSGGRNKISLKNKKCAISNKSIQIGQPEIHRKKNEKRNKKAHRVPHPTPMCKRQAEKSPRRRRRQRIPVLCHLNPKNAWEDSKRRTTHQWTLSRTPKPS